MAAQAPAKRGRPKKDDPTPLLRMGEVGFSGQFSLVPDDCPRELKFPESIQEYKRMSLDATISPALNLVEMAIARVKWEVKQTSPESVKHIKVIEQMMKDIEGGWGAFIRQAVSFNRYGFSVHEIVLRKRLHSEGSLFNDGLFGIKKLPIRPQDTITEWVWDDTGRELTGVKQMTARVKGNMYTSGTDITIPRKKFLLFRNSPIKDTPEGESPLKSCWRAWRYKTELEKIEAIGVAGDMRGFKVIKLNPRYMAEDASPEDRAVFEHWKRILNNIHNGEQSGLIIPSLKDENGEEMIADLSLLSVTGQKTFDVNAIILRYKKEIITTLMASQLILGQEGGGSFSLAENLQSVSQLAIEARLTEIKDVINTHLLPLVFQLNGWDVSEMPEIAFGEVAPVDIEALSKYIQRIAGAGLISQDAKTVNYLADVAGLPIPFDDDTIDVEEVREQTTGNTSKAGVPSNEDPSKDNSTDNADNAS